jgi:hypothetical protein
MLLLQSEYSIRYMSQPPFVLYSSTFWKAQGSQNLTAGESAVTSVIIGIYLVIL